MEKACNSHCRTQWVLGCLVLIVIAAGWKWPWLGFVVPLTMAAGMIGGLLGRGRWVCGNLCPRGSFWDRHFSLVAGRNKPSPSWMKHLGLRWGIFALLIAIMFYRASADISNWRHWGRVFWLMCTVTTAIGLVGGLLYHSRFWCVICPIGTFAATVSGDRNQLRIDDEKCISCHLCDRACPIDIKPEQYRKLGRIADRDCLRCNRCVRVCPKDAIIQKR